MKNPVRIACLAAALCVATPAVIAHATDGSTPDTIAPSTTTLAPATTTTLAPPARRAPLPRVTIAFSRIVLDEQMAYFFNANRRLIATLPVSTGADDQTPVGFFRVFSKSAQTFYTPRPWERMRYMTRFTVGRQGGNIGFHGIPYVVTKSGEMPFYTPLGRAPVSHGCIRMRVSDARWVFQNMPIGAVVSVVRSRR